MTLPIEPSEKALDAAVRALRDMLREKIKELAFDFSDFEPFFMSLRNESDRALPIVAFSYIEDKLRTMMERTINPDITEGAASLFKVFAPLGTASARIKVAAGLYWITPLTYKNLEFIRKVRNAFAHAPTGMSFSSDPVASYLKEMHPVEAPPWKVEAHRMIPHAQASPRILFHVRSCLTCAYLLQELGSAPYAIRMGLPPLAALADGLENYPPPFRAVTTSALRVMLTVGAPRSIPQNS